MGEHDEGTFSIDDEIMIGGATSLTFDRLQKLMNRGYKPDLSVDFADGIWLRHPRSKYKHSFLILYPVGTVVSIYDSTNEIRIDRSEGRAFDRFLASVPLPSWWDKTQNFRGSALAWTILFGGWLLAYLAISMSVSFISRLWK